MFNGLYLSLGQAMIVRLHLGVGVVSGVSLVVHHGDGDNMLDETYFVFWHRMEMEGYGVRLALCDVWTVDREQAAESRRYCYQMS